MNKVIKAPKSRSIQASATLNKYLEISKERFDSLDLVLGGNWDDVIWIYKPTGNNIHFCCDDQVWPEEIVNTAKIFMIKYLWDKRLKGNLPSFSAIRDLLYGPKLLVSAGIDSLYKINQDAYIKAHNQISQQYEISTKIGYIHSLNNLILWLDNEYILSSTVDIIKAPKINQVVPISSKMPDQELIRAIISAKWAIEESEDRSARWESDLLAIYSQSFQYGMGLRIGEVLRLPATPIIWKDNEMFFLVWTEKGSKPMARYVPETWREVFQHSIDVIKKETEPYRNRAIEIEDRGRLTEVEDRFDQYHQGKRAEVETLKQQLDTFLADQSSEAKAKWVLRDTVDPERTYSLKDVQALMPEMVSPTSKSNYMILKSFEKWGLEFVAIPTSRTQNEYYVFGKKILDFIDNQIDFRRNHLVDSELLLLLHGRELCREQSQDPFIVERRILRDGGIALAYTMKDINEFNGGRRPPSTISRSHALEIIECYAGGGFDTSKFIDFKSFQTLFPDLYSSGLAISISRYDCLPKELRCTDKVRFYAKASGAGDVYKYKPVTGYLLEQESVHEFIKSEFNRRNLAIEKEIYDESQRELIEIEQEERLNKKETELNAVIISSRSFKVQQKVSDYLFLRASDANLQLIPEIMGYKAILYSFKGNDRSPGLFERYGVSDDKELVEKFQSQKGRHWQTTSLFRSGLSAEITNSWMGRTMQQGAHYDHNTDIERAKQIQRALLEDTQRIIGPVADRVREFLELQIPLESIEDFLEQELQTVQHTPLGLCCRPIFLKPCDLNMKCLTGNNGKGCKHYALDIGDMSQITKLQAFRDRTGREIERLVRKLEEGYAAAEMHIESESIVFNNANLVLRGAYAILENNPGNDGEYLPFKKGGSYPSDCPFQCGDDK